MHSLVVSGQRSAVSGQWSAVSGQWSVVSGQWSAVSGQWSAVSGQRSVVSCQWSAVSGQRLVVIFRLADQTGVLSKVLCWRHVTSGQAVTSDQTVGRARLGSDRRSQDTRQQRLRRRSGVARDRADCRARPDQPGRAEHSQLVV